MKAISLILSIFITSTVAVPLLDGPKSYILFYPPDQGAAMAQAKGIIARAGGKILYEYSKFIPAPQVQLQ
jgi:hypothetical protein